MEGFSVIDEVVGSILPGSTKSPVIDLLDHRSPPLAGFAWLCLAWRCGVMRRASSGLIEPLISSTGTLSRKAGSVILWGPLSAI